MNTIFSCKFGGVKKLTLLLAVSLLLVTLTGISGGAQQVPQSIRIEPPSNPELTVKIWTDRSTYTIGDSIQIFLNVSQPAYVYVLDYDTEGNMKLIFPNRFSQQNKIDAGTYKLPDGNYDFQVEGPPGTEYLQVLATTSKVDISQFLANSQHPYQDNAFPRVPNPQKLKNEIKSSLRAEFHLQFGGEDPGAEFKLVPVKWDSATTSFRIVSEQANQPPRVNFSFNPSNPNVGQYVLFDGSNSNDPDGNIAQYRWDFNNDGNMDGSGRRIYNKFNSPGKYRVTLTVRDNQGATNSTTKTIVVGQQNRAPSARFTYTPHRPSRGQTVRFDASNSSDPDGYVNAYLWDFDGDGNTDARGKVVTQRFWTQGKFTVKLTVRDNQGGTDSIGKSLTVGATRPSFVATKPDSFQSNGNRQDGWYWNSSWNSYSKWSWYSLDGSPQKAYLNFHLKVSNEINGGSGFGATVDIKIQNRWGNTIETGTVDLANTFRPQVSTSTDGVGYNAYGSYRISNPSAIEDGFTVRIEWPPQNSRNVFATQQSSVILAFLR